MKSTSGKRKPKMGFCVRRMWCDGCYSLRVPHAVFVLLIKRSDVFMDCVGSIFILLSQLSYEYSIPGITDHFKITSISSRPPSINHIKKHSDAD